jgi:hypothetical protein
VILVVTRKSVNCQWREFELQMALVGKKLEDIIIPCLEDVVGCQGLSKTLAFMLKRQQAVLEWTDNVHGQNLF